MSNQTKSTKSTNNVITAKDIVTNYESLYKTTGGGIKVGNLDIAKFTKSLVNNRILDLYLKYMGIKILTTTTLVPLALIMGRDLFESAVKNIMKSDQSGGSFIKNKIPELDDALIGNYLKLTGIAAANLSVNTLIPLGILMVIYDMYINEEQSGGRVSLPSKYFNPENNETYVDTVPEHSNSNPNPPTSNTSQIMNGGGSDWVSSQRSRGAVNSPGMNESQFRMFTKTADYMSNKDLSMGLADSWNSNYGVDHKTLYNDNIHTGNPEGNSLSGVPTNQFGNGYTSKNKSGKINHHNELDGGHNDVDYIEGSDGNMGPNDLLIDQRHGYADVSTVSHNVKASLQHGGKISIDTIRMFRDFLENN